MPKYKIVNCFNVAYYSDYYKKIESLFDSLSEKDKSIEVFIFDAGKYRPFEWSDYKEAALQYMY